MEHLNEIIIQGVNMAVLIIQYLLFRFIKKSRVTTDSSNVQTISQIADNLNKLYKSVQIAMESAGSPTAADSEKVTDAELSPEEQEMVRAARKARLWQSARAGRVKA